jgi:hypothetical protein
MSTEGCCGDGADAEALERVLEIRTVLLEALKTMEPAALLAMSPAELDAFAQKVMVDAPTRKVILSNGTEVLVDADDPNTDEQIRAALETDDE